MTDPVCPGVGGPYAELAMGLLDGRERAEAMAHVDGCPTCRQELEDLSRVADELVALTPAVEPPPGFEARVLARTVKPVVAPVVRLARPSAWWAAVAAGLVLVAGAVGWGAGHSSSHAPSASSVPVALTSTGHEVGEMVAYPGAHPWVSVVVLTGGRPATVTCELKKTGGGTVSLGYFRLPTGGGYWTEAVGGPRTEVAGAVVIARSGRVIATARFPVGTYL